MARFPSDHHGMETFTFVRDVQDVSMRGKCMVSLTLKAFSLTYP